MFDTRQIYNQISEYTERGIKDFVIFPYGENGELTKNVLYNAFGITPIALIDNNPDRILKGSISLEEFKTSYLPHQYVILTIESEEVHNKLLSYLKTIVDERLVIDLLDYQRVHRQEYYDCLKKSVQLDVLFGLKQKDLKKIRTRIVHSRTQTWNSIASLCEEVQRDPEMDLLVIIGWDQRLECERQVKKHGYHCIWWEDYNAEEDDPDILVLSQPYDNVTRLDGIREKVKLVVVANTLLIRNTQSMSRFWAVQKAGFDRFVPDYHLCDSLLYQDIKKDYSFSAKLVEMGNAKFDGIYKACKEGSFPKAWNKLIGKKVVLWAGDHGIYENVVIHTTFDLYAKTIIKYFEEHDDMGLIVRLHHDLIEELISSKFWVEADVTRFIELINNMENAVYDVTETYDGAFSMSDAILTDICCGITVSALPTEKPICAMLRTGYEQPFHPELTDNYYLAHSSEELTEYLDMVRNGDDPKKEVRQALAKKYVKHFDGRNGFRIKEFIKCKYKEAD